MGKGQILEVGVGYVIATSDVPANASTNVNSTDDWNNFIYNPYAGTDIKSKVEAFLVELSYSAYF